MPPTLADLIESNRRLADSNFATAASINKLTPVLDQLRRDVYDVKVDREIDVDKHQQTVSQINEKLAVLTATVTRLPVDVTGAFKLAQAEALSPAERMFARLEKAPTSTKLLTLVLVIILAFSGWLTHLLAG